MIVLRKARLVLITPQISSGSVSIPPQHQHLCQLMPLLSQDQLRRHLAKRGQNLVLRMRALTLLAIISEYSLSANMPQLMMLILGQVALPRAKSRRIAHCFKH
jgi:hypothetical protein